MKIFKSSFWITIFLNAFLLFLVQPIFNRMLLPVVGSSMSVWNIALMCFQVLLLAGYMYTHYLPKIIGYKFYIKVHITLMILSAIFSIMFFKSKQLNVDTNNPSIDLIIILLSNIGIPYFMLSTSSTNFQKWYGLVNEDSPYYLYSISNSGNLLALVGYGLFIEVLFGLKNQILIWNTLYAIMTLSGVYIGVSLYKRLKTNNFNDVEKHQQIKKEPIKSKRKLYWLILSFIPCSLMTGTNTLLSNVLNVGKINYYWIIPLIIYLLAYIVAFSNMKLLDISIYEKISFYLVMIMMGTFLISNDYIYLIAMITLFMVSLVCNIYLTKDKPDPSNLTDFYLYIAIGGALGGIFTSLIAPVIFSDIYEYPLILALFIVILFIKHKREKQDIYKIEQWEYSIIFLIMLIFFIMFGLSKNLIIFLVLSLLVFMIRRLYIDTKTRYISLAILFFISIVANYTLLSNLSYQDRNFYCVKRVVNSEYIDENGDAHTVVNLLNGNTIHGSQFEIGSKKEFDALSYYHKDGSTIGRFLSDNKHQIKNVGAVGLGIGILSSMSTEEQVWKYFEIDPQVVEIAKNPKYFSIVNKCEPEIVVGDARITLKEETDKSYDVLILDAYSGGLISTNLLTIEAIDLYKSKIKDDGILFFHITNNHYDLKPVLSKASEQLEISCYIDSNSSIDNVTKVKSEWIMMTNNKEIVSDNWAEINKYNDFKLWTDDKHSISTILK